MIPILTYQEIKERFSSEWVLVGNPETTETFEIIRGAVLWHSKDRDEVYRKAREMQPQRFAFLFTGTLPQDTAIVL